MTQADLLKLAAGHHQAGRLDLAESLYRRIVQADPECHEALYLSAVLAGQRGMLDEAVGLARAAARICPTSFQYSNLLGQILVQQGNLSSAEESFRQALELNPHCAEAHFNLGGVCRQAGKESDAIGHFQRALEIEPANVAACLRLGDLVFSGDRDAGIRYFRRALEIDPSSREARACLALGYVALGAVYSEQGDTTRMFASYQSALEVDPGNVDAHWDLSHAYLRHGRFREGWAEYEWRWKWKRFTSPVRNFRQPAWRGEPLKDRRILLHAEQGLGDTLQFVRYVPLVAVRGGRVILEVPRTLLRLCSSIPGVGQLVPAGSPLPEFDFHCPLMSLPLAFETDLETIPSQVPYLSAPAEFNAVWAAQLAGPGFKVGLVWAGGPKHTRDRHRSLPLERLAPPAGLNGIRFFSLQKGAAARESARAPAGMDLTDLGVHIRDFADTAAILAGLDLVITVDTAVAHLAGALGRPVWILVAKPSDWRWLLDREDSPWYPTARLFRQSEPDDWQPVLTRLFDALAAVTAG